MEVSRNSWHYRLVKTFEPKDEDIPQNLCGYFWTLVIAILTWSLVGALISLFAYATGTAFFGNLYSHGIDPRYWDSSGQAFLSLGGIFALIALGCWLMPNVMQNLCLALYGFIFGILAILAVIGVPIFIIHLYDHGLKSTLTIMQYGPQASASLLSHIYFITMVVDIFLAFVALLIGVIVGIIYSCKFFHKFEFVQLFLAFLKAKKDKYCLKLNFTA